VRAQELGAPSREITRSEDSRRIQVMGGPLDQNPSPIMHSGVWRLRGVTFNIRSHEVPKARHEGHVEEPQSGPGK
jgi:hypothetical protein